MKKYHYTYLITNLDPKDERKYYFGVRSCDCLPEEDVSYMGSSESLKDHINQFGEHQFQKTIFYVSLYSREDAHQNEIDYHNEYDVGVNPTFYNKCKTTSTGFDRSGVPSSEETKELLRKQRRVCSSETRKKLSDANKGKTIPEEQKKKISETLKGREITEEHRKKISESKSGKSWGTHSEETKQKMSDVQEGTIYITDGDNIKRIKFDEEIPEGWKRGSNLKDKFIIINNGIIDKRLNKGLPIPKGWKEGKSNKNKYIRITDDEKMKYHPSDEPIPEGWKRLTGQSGTTGKICINNGSMNKFILKDDPIPEGWKRGKYDTSKYKEAAMKRKNHPSPLIGRKHSDETKRKMSESKRRRDKEKSK